MELLQYSHFKTATELEAAFNKHLAENGDRLNKSDFAVLDLIRDASLEDGAAHMTHTSMAEATGKSLSTVRRAIRKLEKLGFIERAHYIQPVVNGLGANIYMVLPYHV